jgi:excisionase family DNA binding protein
MARPKGPRAATLAARNVIATADAGGYRLICGQCGATWVVTPTGGRLAPGYWQCPTGCNTAAADAGPAPGTPEPTAATAVIPTDLAQLPAILTPSEAAALLRVAELTVKDWARAGALPGAFKLGKEWRIERQALLAYIRGS